MNANDIKDTFIVTHVGDLIQVLFTQQVVDAKNNVRRAVLSVKEVFDIFDDNPGNVFNIYIDMSAMGESFIPLEANGIYLQALRRKEISKVAIVGNAEKQSRVLSFVAPFIVGRGKKVSWFTTRNEAMEWLEK